MEFAVSTLASQLTGINPMVARFSEGLLLFAEGTAAVFTVVGGIAAIGLAIALMGADARHATEQMLEMEKELERIGPHGKLLAEQFRLDALKEQLADMQKQSKASWMGIAAGGVVDFWKGVFGFDTIADQVAAQQEKVNAAMRDYNKLLEQRDERNFENNASMEEFVTRTSRAVDLMGQEAMGAKGLEETLRRIFEEQEAARQGPAAVAVLGSQRGANEFFGSDAMREIDEQVNRALTETTRALDAMDEKTKEKMFHIGMNAIRSLIDGIFQGTINFGDILKNLIEAFVLAKIEGPLKKILGIASPSTVGMEVGAMLAQGIGIGLTTANLGPMKLNLNVNTGNMPAPLTPFEAARDRSWQALLRESQLVGQSQGFRLRGQ